MIGIKNGDWVIINGSSQKKLPKDYHDVGNFDQQGFAYFAKDGHYGIIDAEGKEVFPAECVRMESFGWGYFGGIGEETNMLINLKDELVVDTCSRWDKIDKHWTYYFESREKKLLNFYSGRTIALDSATFVVESQLGYTMVNSDGKDILYDPKGDVVDLEGGFAHLREHYVRLKNNDSHHLILANSESFELPIKTTDFKFDGNYFQYSIANRTVRTDLFGEVLLDVPYGSLKDAGFNRFVFGDKGKFGIMDGQGKILVPAEYLFINSTREGYFVTKASGTGILNKRGGMEVPCKFESINKQGNLYIVESETGLFGVYSAKAQKLIVPTTFKKITISEDRIRGWFNETLQILYYNADHGIDKKITLNNTVSRFALAQSTGDFDPRLLTVGWFFEEKPKFDDEGFNIGTIQKWGIKDAADSVLANPRYSTPMFVPSAGFSLIPMGVRKMEFMGSQLKDKKVYNAIDLNTGRIIPGDFLDIDTTDALTREYLRFSSQQGFGYITQDNKVHKVFHFDRENDTYLRFSTSETGDFEKKLNDEHREAFKLSTFKLNDPENPSYRTWKQRNDVYTHVVLKDAKWNFLHPTGQPMFPEPFDFADRFYKHTAIVKKNGKWGVVNTDSLMIPAEFSSIDRMKEFNDTVFRVRNTRPGDRILDRQANELKYHLTEVKKAKKEYAIVLSGREEMVINSDHKIISSEGERFRDLNDRYFLARVDRMSNVYDSEGNLFASIDAKPKDVFFDAFILYREGSRYGLVDSRGDTLLPEEYKSIEQYGDLLLAEGKDTRIYDHKGEELFVFLTEKILIDSVTNRIAVCEGDKVTILESDGTKVEKIKGIAPDIFVNGMLIKLGSRGFAMAVEEGTTVPQHGIKTIESAGETGYILETRDGWVVVDLNWNVYESLAGNFFRRCKHLGDGVLYLNKPGNHLFSKRYGKFYIKASPTGEYNSGFVLVKLREENKYVFLTPEGKNEFEQKFTEAKPFQDGYAAVKMRRGWTIIDANGRAKSLDSFGEIDVHGLGLFTTQSSSLFGLIDHHGKVILETEYERLEVLHGDVIQAVKEGEFFYFKLDGTPIEY
ncbi:MAG: WG repeat-containing protein [bacterium]|nr:WG repeat-containing protein [bacterium]